MFRLYADRQAATPLKPEVFEAMLPYFQTNFGNAQSLHSLGQRAAEAVEKAREQVAALIGAESEEIIFTSSGSEANNLAIKGLALANQAKGRQIVISAIEHISVHRSVKFLEKFGFQTKIIPVDENGQVKLEKVKEAITPDTVLVSIMLANSEIGTIQPLEAIGRFCQEKGILFHSDAVAAVGSIPVKVKELGVQALSLAADQFYGPKGAAALYLKKGVKLVPLIEGGNQEGNRRAGTENVPAIVGLGKAAELAAKNLEASAKDLKALRDKLVQGVMSRVEEVILTGHPVERLPHHASFCVKFVEGESMLLSLDLKGMQVASGSACTSRSLKVSPVLLAIGLDHATAQGSLVLTLLDETNEDEVDYFLETFPPIVQRLRQMSPLYTKFLQEKKDVH
ncbi:MAG TPA: cysteine desulfurase [Candidatus Aminicenantes bacterium]|nr:cysteine desulfurase [Candidatus Aminicenantes bacterium]